MSEYRPHYSVQKEDILSLSREVIKNCSSKLFVDLTFGAGGHSFSFLEEFPGIQLISFDQDFQAIENGRKNIEKLGFQNRIELIHSNFEAFPEKYSHLKGKCAVILMDLGVSSHHFDEGTRGFSFRFEGPLDMRMNPDSGGPSCEELIKTLNEMEIEKILREYGEEKFSKRIASRIVETRSQKPLKTTKDLEALVWDCYPQKLKHGRIHPATKTFQAFRIAVNRELEVLQETLGKLFDFLDYNGMVMAISFHSLEDRIVKNVFRNLSQEHKEAENYSKKPILPSKEEIFENSRSRSAKLRVVKRVLEKKSKNKYAHFSKGVKLGHDGDEN